MNLFRSALSACVLRELPNMRLYLHPDRWPEKHPLSSFPAAKKMLPVSPAN
jgi:hypothetical protein